jgi:hypothetical protein
MPTAAAAITAVAIQPTVFRTGGSGKRPMMELRLPGSLIMTMIGTAATSLITALQKSAFIGSM